MPTPLSPFPLLTSPSTYTPCTWNLTTDHEGRAYWVSFFSRYIETIAALATDVERSHGHPPEQIAPRTAAAIRDLRAKLAAFAAHPTTFAPEEQPITLFSLDIWRDQVLRRHGLLDPFELVKNRENEKMLPLLPTVCAQLDALPLQEQIRAIVEGVFAGNIFDLGVEATANRFLGHSPDFFSIRQTLAPRPWLIDNFDALAADLTTHAATGKFRKAVFFIDNAGSDFILGATPFIRFLAQHGSTVILAANERPTLNDMTIAEVRRFWPRMTAAEPSLAPLPIHLLSTGTGEPLINLSQVSPELNTAAENADLVILEGMGRGIESNLNATFTCKALNIAMIKDPNIAHRQGGKIYDCICKYR